jgi:hypothetical protein
LSSTTLGPAVYPAGVLHTWSALIVRTIRLPLVGVAQPSPDPIGQDVTPENGFDTRWTGAIVTAAPYA